MKNKKESLPDTWLRYPLWMREMIKEYDLEPNTVRITVETPIDHNYNMYGYKDEHLHTGEYKIEAYGIKKQKVAPIFFDKTRKKKKPRKKKKVRRKK